MKEFLTYAHCIKFTPGQLDCAPHSRYEARTVIVETIPVRDENDQPEWQVKSEAGKCLACETLLGDAMALASYELMNASRDLAYHNYAANNKPINP